MRAADIPDEEFLAAVREAATIWGSPSAMRWDVGLILEGAVDFVRAKAERFPAEQAWQQSLIGRSPAVPAGLWLPPGALLPTPPPKLPPAQRTRDIPYLVVRAKADSLYRRGLLDGCVHCSCRGDYEALDPPRAPVEPSIDDWVDDDDGWWGRRGPYLIDCTCTCPLEAHTWGECLAEGCDCQGGWADE